MTKRMSRFVTVMGVALALGVAGAQSGRWRYE